MKKILHMTPPIINNGVYQYLFNHLKYLDRENYKFDFLTRNAVDLMAVPEYKKYHFQIQTFYNTERDGADGLRKEMIRILSQGYDAIHLHTSFWRGFLIEEIAMEMKVPRVIVHSHSSGIDVENELERRELYKIHQSYKDKFDDRYATDFCACSSLAAKWLFGSQIKDEKIKILRNAIEVQKYLFHPQKRNELRKRLGLDRRIIIGTAGRFCYQKNHEFLIRAFAKAYQYNHQLFLILIGEGELEGTLRNLIEKLNLKDAVLCMGWQENIQDLLQLMDLFCLPSKFEGFPITLIEAQASGLKCLVSDTITEEIKISELVKFLPLSEREWTEEIAGCSMDGDRQDMDRIITESGYNIEQEIKCLQQLYD